MMLKITLAITWLTVLVGSGLLYRRVDHFGRNSEEVAIAKVVALRGSVAFRPESMSVWRDLVRNQELAEGTLIATSADGLAELEFIEGTHLQIGHSSQLALTLRSDSKSPLDFLVTLIKGEVAAQSPAVKSRPKLARGTNPAFRKATFSVRNGTDTLTFDNSQDSRFSLKGDSQSPPQIQIAKGTAIVRQKGKHEKNRISGATHPETAPLQISLASPDAGGSLPPEKIGNVTIPKIPGLRSLGANISRIDPTQTMAGNQPKALSKGSTLALKEIQKGQDIGTELASPKSLAAQALKKPDASVSGNPDKDLARPHQDVAPSTTAPQKQEAKKDLAPGSTTAPPTQASPITQAQVGLGAKNTPTSEGPSPSAQGASASDGTPAHSSATDQARSAKTAENTEKTAPSAASPVQAEPSATEKNSAKESLTNEQGDTKGDSEIAFRFPLDGQRLWHTESIFQTKGPSIPIQLQGKLDAAEKWLVRVSNKNGSKFWTHQLRPGESEFPLPLAEVAKLNASQSAGKVREIALNLQILPASPTDANSKNIPSPSLIRLNGTGDYPDGPVIVLLADIDSSEGSGWIAQSGALEVQDAKAMIHLSSSKNLSLLAPLLRGSPKFRIIPSERKPDGTGVFLLSGGAIAAKISGKHLSQDEITLVSNLLKSEGVVRGNSASIAKPEPELEPVPAAPQKNDKPAPTEKIKIDPRLLQDKSIQEMVKESEGSKAPENKSKNLEVIDTDSQ